MEYRHNSAERTAMYLKDKNNDGIKLFFDMPLGWRMVEHPQKHRFLEKRHHLLPLNNWCSFFTPKHNDCDYSLTKAAHNLFVPNDIVYRKGKGNDLTIVTQRNYRHTHVRWGRVTSGTDSVTSCSNVINMTHCFHGLPAPNIQSLFNGAKQYQSFLFVFHDDSWALPRGSVV